MKKIVITGGPCAGKTTVVEFLREELQTEAIFVPEAATMLLSGGFPPPPEGQFLGEEQFNVWMQQFQAAVYHTQIALEDLAMSEAERGNKSLILHDRARADVIAYHPHGLAGFIFQFHINAPSIHAHYDMVIFLESLAVGQPEMFGRFGNEHRYESLEHAIEANARTRRAWYTHPNFRTIDSRLSLQEKTIQVRELIIQTMKEGE